MIRSNLKNEFIDQQFEFKGQWDLQSLCGLKIVEKANKTIVIVTELYDENPGTSVTSFVAGLAGQICTTFGIALDKLLLIEQTPDRGSKLSFYDEAFDMVSFTIENNTFVKPQWQRISKDDLRQIVSKTE